MLEVRLLDMVYFATLIMCISLGSHYRQISDIETKRNYGTGLGILITYLICGYKIYHTVLIIWGNIIIIKCCDKQYIHQLSLAYTWTYLTYINLNKEFEDLSYDYWILQMISLRLVGLAFEIHITSKYEAIVKVGGKPNIELEEMPSDLTATDIIAYAYYFIGLHKGPYYRWKVFQDHFSSPISSLGNFRVITEQKLKKAFACGVIYIVLCTNYPVEMYCSKEFYTTYGTESRYLYNIPQLMMYCLKYHVILLLCTSVCTQSGFGVYPAQCMSTPGHGPSTRKPLPKISYVGRASKEYLPVRDSKSGLEQEYNFGTLKSFDVDKLLFGPRMRDTLKSWEKSIRYWFWAYPYKHVMKSKKVVRTAFAYFIWSVWQGLRLQSIIVMCTLWIHVNLEDEFIKLFDTDAGLSVSWDIGLSLMRMFCLIYLIPCYIIVRQEVILQYYNSIYWIFHLILAVLLAIAIIIQKANRSQLTI